MSNTLCMMIFSLNQMNSKFNIFNTWEIVKVFIYKDFICQLKKISLQTNKKHLND